MKIKSYFYLLVLGSILVPALTLVSQRVFWDIREQNTRLELRPVSEEIEAFLDEPLSPKSAEAISFLIARRRPNTNIAVMRSDFLVVYSTIEGVTAGSREAPEALLARLRSPGDGLGYTFETPFMPGGERLHILLQSERLRQNRRSDRRNPSPPPVFPPMPGFILVVTALSVLFVLVMSFVISRKITGSVAALEQAAGRIAAGELDAAPSGTGINEMTSLTKSFNQMHRALKDAELRRSRFIMGITHDLKTPLSLIKGYAEAIKDGVASGAEARRSSLNIIIAKSDQLEGMIDDLLDFVRVDSADWQRKLERAPLAPFLTAFAKRAAQDAEVLGRRVESSVSVPEGVCAPFDERLATRALENLVNNAIRYTARDGVIGIAAHLSGDGERCLVEISDNGQGIDEKDLPHIFEIFYRGTSSRREEGLGLGLSIVKGVIDSHRWSIEAFSEKGLGSRFVITIPVTQG